MAQATRLALIAVLGCAPAATQQRMPLPADVPRLEQSLRRDSTDLGVRISLAIAYRESGRPVEARRILESVVAERPRDPGPVLLLGLAWEAEENWSRARETYARYVDLARPTALRTSIERRIRYVHRRELEAGVRAALAAETPGNAVDPDPRIVAVFPFLFLNADTTLRPLSRAMAEMLVTDLGRTDRIRLLERLQVQLLLDEIALGARGLVDPATAARSGRLLSAGRAVQGTIEGDAEVLRLQAVTLGVGRDTIGPLSPVTEQDALVRLFDMEKRLALGIYASLGIELTIAERARVLERATQNVEALLAFGRGLEAEDRGDWAEAVRQYQRALALDPQFGLATVRSEEAGAIGEAGETSLTVLVENGIGVEVVPLEIGPTNTATAGINATSSPGGLKFGPDRLISPDPIRGILPDPLQRDAGSEVLGQEGLGSRTILRIIFRRPGT
jgi:tetratricopeptide (TPR) repeat protein